MAKPKRKSNSKAKSKSKAKSNSQAWIIAAIVVLVGFAGFWFFRSTQIVEDQTLPAEISVDQAYQEYQAGVYFLDVRTPEEWNDHHVPGTTLIPLDELPDRISEVPRVNQVIFVCTSGALSRSSLERVYGQGFEGATNMDGGMNAWEAAGYELQP